LHAALQDDPGFALAYVRLGDEQNPEDLSGTSFTDYRRAMALARSGRRLSKRELLRLDGDYDLDVGDERAAAARFAAYSALYPGDYLGWFYQAYPDVAIGAPARAEAALRSAQRLRPDSEPVAANLAYVELWRGETAAAHSEVARMAGMPGAQSDAELTQGLVDIARDDASRAVQAFAAAAGSPDAYRRTLAPRLEADALAEMGEDARAEALLRATMTHDAGIETPSGIAELHLDLAYLQMQAARHAAAVRDCDAAIAAYASPHVLVEAGTMLARMGDLAAARRALAALAPYRDQRPAVTIATLRLQGEIRLAQGDRAAALALLRRAGGLSDALDDREYLAHALTTAGHPRLAERLYARAADPARVWVFAEPALPGWYAHLAFQAARLAQQLGLAGTRTRWERYLQLRAHADPGLPGVRYARQALRQTEGPRHD
jgi:hypothetical protein